jgi:integrase
MRRYVWPAAKRAKITKRIGWHTFRHTYSTLLRANGEDVKVVQELLRHANSKPRWTRTRRPYRQPSGRRRVVWYGRLSGKRGRIWLDGSYQTLALGVRF